jgi:REP element-mobilizing transposase RayT
MLIRYFKDPCPGREGIFMFTSDHQLRQLIFKTASDFSYGVNTLAIGTLKYNVRILCYTLMNNHLHLLVMGSYENCLAYFRWVLLRLAQMLKARYGISGILKANNADVQYVTDSQMFLNEVAYLLRNSFKAHIDSPYSYPWAPFEMYFNPYLENIRGERFPSTDAAMKILGTHALIPEDWEHRNGTILNKCFVDYRTAERLLGSGYTLFNRIRKFDTESAIAKSHGVEEQLTFTDNELQEKIQAVCQNELHVNSPHQLGRKDLLRLARTLANRFSATKKQISRLLGIEPAVLENVL